MLVKDLLKVVCEGQFVSIRNGQQFEVGYPEDIKDSLEKEVDYIYTDEDNENYDLNIVVK